MKKILSIVAIVALFATSCVKSELDNVQVVPGGEEVVTLTLQTPNLGSRAIAEGDKATDLHYAIYDENWNALVVEQTTINISKTLELCLVKNKEYNLVFWAQSPSATCYAVDLGAVGDLAVDPSIVVDYANANANDDHRDAFFGQKTLTVNGTINETVYLKRPFAQINFGTNDTAVAATGGFDIRANDATTTFTARAYNTLYLKDGSVENEQDVTFVAAALPEVHSFTTSLGDYDWLAMNYLLWPDAADLSLSTCKMTVTAQGQNITVEYPGAPARRNYRTNLVGSLLTEEGNIEVIILPATDGDYTIEGENTYVTVSNLDDLKAAIARTDIDVIALSGNVVVDEDLTADLQGKTITGNWASSEGAVINVAAGSTLTLSNGTITSTGVNGGSTIWNEGTTVLTDMTLVGAPNGTSGNASYALNTTGAGSSVELNNVNISGRGTVGATAGTKVEVNGGNYHTPAVAWGHAIYASGADTEVVINDGVFSEGYEYKADNWGMYQIYAGNGSKVIVNGGDFSQDWDCSNGYDLATSGTGAIEIKGGVFAEDPSSQNGKNYVADGYAVAKDNDGNYIILVKTTISSDNADALKAALSSGQYALMEGRMYTSASEQSGYGATGFLQTNGGVIDGGGNYMWVPATTSYISWDSAITTTGGTIKNLDVWYACRAILINSGTNTSKVYLDNVNITADRSVAYALSCDSGSGKGLEATNCKLYSQVSYSANLGDAKFVGCEFGPNTKYLNSKALNAYSATEFVGCEFKSGYTVNAVAACSFKNCTLDGVALTASNIASLVSAETIANATIK